MTQGMLSSLNLTLARLNSIESNFVALKGLSDELNTQAPVSKSVQNSEFKAILDEKLNNNTQKVEADVKATPLDNTIKEPNREAISLKSKIDAKIKDTDIDEIIDTFCEKYNMDNNFIKAVIKQESGFNAKALSKKGAMGLMQLMPSTAKSLGVINAFNPWENVEGGVKYLKSLEDKFKGDKKLALAAYNAGPNAVKRYGGIPPYKETQNYVNSIMGIYEKLQDAQGGKL